MAQLGRPPSARTLVDRQLGRNRKKVILPPDNTFNIPNHSGDHTAGTTSTPINPNDLVNKSYVDGLSSGLWEVNGTSTRLITADEVDMQSKDLLNVNDITTTNSPMSLANQTGQIITKFNDVGSSAVNYIQLSNTLTNFGAEVRAKGTDTNIDLSLVPKGSGKIDVNSSRILNVLDPTSNQHAATKKYVDDNSGGISAGDKVADITTIMPPDTASASNAQGQTYTGGTTIKVVHRGIAFNASSDEYMDYQGIMLGAYDGSSDVKVQIPILPANATTGNAVFSAQVGKIVYGTTDLDGDIFSGSTAQTFTKAIGSQGVPQLGEITLTNAQMNSISAGDSFVLRIFRDVSADTVANDIIVLPNIMLVLA